MALSYESDEIEETFDDPLKNIEELRDFVERQEAWFNGFKDRMDIFEDDVILGASVITRYSGESTSSMTIKSFENPSFSWPISLGSAGVNAPAVRLWYMDGRHVAKYENRVQDASGQVRGYKLILDLDLLESE